MKERRDYMFTLVRQWRESGLTRQEFCLQHGITVGKFGYWISRWKEDQSGVSARPNTYFLSDCSAVVLRSK